MFGALILLAAGAALFWVAIELMTFIPVLPGALFIAAGLEIAIKAAVRRWTRTKDSP